MTETNSFINVHDLKLEFFYFLHKTFILSIYSWIIMGTADSLSCLAACFLMVVNITGAFGKALLPGIPHCLAKLVQDFLQELFLMLSENSQQVQAVMP